MYQQFAVGNAIISCLPFTAVVLPRWRECYHWLMVMNILLNLPYVIVVYIFDRW